MPRIQLTDHFFEDEFACRCRRCAQGSIGRLPFDRFSGYVALAGRLEILRTSIRVPLTVVSGYRCSQHPEFRAGSYHSRENPIDGVAVDVKVRSELDDTRIVRPGLWLAGHLEALISAGLVEDGGLGTYVEFPRTLHYDSGPSGRRWRRENHEQ